MKSIFLLAALAIAPAAAADHNIELTYYLASHHISGEYDFNDDHNFIGIEYRTGDHGFALASFTNSFYKPAYLASYAHYWQPLSDVETGLRIGVASGYDGIDECMGDGLYSACPVVALEVSYTKYAMVVPKLSLMPGVVTLSFSARF